MSGIDALTSGARAMEVSLAAGSYGEADRAVEEFLAQFDDEGARTVASALALLVRRPFLKVGVGQGDARAYVWLSVSDAHELLAHLLFTWSDG